MSDSSESHASGLALPLANAEGAFLAFAAGDALGWPQEMPRNVLGGSSKRGAHIELKRWTRRSGGRFHPFEEVIQPGGYSDDTQLALAVARSRTNHGSAWWKAFTRVELPLWTLYERGGGGATKRAVNAWLGGYPPWRSSREDDVRRYFAAGGNGVAMRVLPHALFLAGQESTAELMHDVVLDGSATHGHPRALVGATAYAYAAWSLARRSTTLRFGELLDMLIDEAPEWSRFPRSDREGGSWFAAADSVTDGPYDRIWTQTTREMRELLETARKGLKAGALADDHAILKELGCLGREKGAGTRSTAAAVYLAARHAAQPVQGILRAAFENGADTDTLAAMTGGLMGCLAGVEWLPPSWLQVQDARYIRHIASRVASGPESAQQKPLEPLPPFQSIVSDLSRKRESEVILGCGTRARATALPDPKPIAKSIVVRAWRLKTSDGQTLYVTKAEHLAGKTPTGRPADKPDSRSPTSSAQVSGKTAADPGMDPKTSLYTEFCRQLRRISGDGETRYAEVENALGLVRSQTDQWLEQAEQDGLIQRTARRPKKFVLCESQIIR